MGLDPRKRQKKLERRKSRAKAKKKALARRGPDTPAARIQRAATAPILHCCTTDVLWDEGMSNVLVSRRLNNGSVAYAVFLLDIYCLGVKDVVFDVVPQSHYDRQVYDKMFEDYQIVELQPEAMRKLIEGAVDYARDIGLSPHADYRKAKLIFGDIDAESSAEEFVYGKDGQPFFIAGPHDSQTRCNQIIRALASHCGPDGFDYMTALPAMAD